jgi:hypothetical protein
LDKRNEFDPREIIVIGFIKTSLEDFMSGLRIDVKERLANPLEDVIEPQIGRKFGVLISEDDFSAEEAIDYKPAAIWGIKTNLEDVSNNLSEIAKLIAQASAQRDCAKKEMNSANSQKNG